MDSTQTTLHTLRRGDLIRIRTTNGGRSFGMFASADSRDVWDSAVGEALPEPFVRVVNRGGTFEVAVRRISAVEIVLTDVEIRAVSA